jgi:hypothetical protein
MYSVANIVLKKSLHSLRNYPKHIRLSSHFPHCICECQIIVQVYFNTCVCANVGVLDQPYEEGGVFITKLHFIFKGKRRHIVVQLLEIVHPIVHCSWTRVS